jgi:chromosome segregation ATPase
MNLKTLGFDKREEALLILETALEKRDQMISDKEAASTPLQLRAAITQLKGELGAVIEEKETLQKKLEAELKEDSEAHIKLAELQQKYSSLQAELKAVREKEIKVETEIDSANASKGALKSEIKDLQKTLHDLEEEKVRSVDIDEDVRTVLEITDQLLEHLPDHVLKRFVQSTNFSIFQKVFKKYNVE